MARLPTVATLPGSMPTAYDLPALRAAKFVRSKDVILVKPTRATTALHEAGHAVVAIALRWIIEWMEILPNGEGRIAIAATRPEDATVGFQGIIAWAGAVAEKLDWISGIDVEVFKKHRSTQEFIRMSRELAAFHVSKHETAILAVAEALEREGRLEGVAVRRIAIAASPRLRRYAAPVVLWKAARR